MDAVTRRNVDEWLAIDTDPESLAYVAALKAACLRGDAAAVDEAAERFRDQIAFGTAGLRSRVGPGFARMNAVTVQLASQGVASYLEGEARRNGQSNYDVLVVIGRDHRHGSLEFAQVAARTLNSRGFEVRLMARHVPTPFVPFAVRHFQAAFGIMVTASHNPKDDNGYKVYGPSGCQINSPVDKHIAALIPAAGRRLWDLAGDAWFEDPCDEIHRAYTASTAASFAAEAAPAHIPSIVYTAMHGVGYAVVADVVRAAGLPPLLPCTEQVEPDWDFPTVRFPNPEEGAGALRLACAEADRTGARLVFANDPDADRFNFVERQPAAWRVFNGNQIALLLADFLLRHRRGPKPTAMVAMVASTVSSQALGWMARAEGFRFEQAETGFKNLSAKVRELEAEGYDVLLTYEEAIGYMVGNTVYDKDGISALLCAYHMAIEAACAGETLAARLDALHAKYGHQVQYNSYYFCRPATPAKLVLQHARGVLAADAASVAGHAVAAYTDYAPASMIKLAFASGAWLAIRTSGTEPKIKFYSEARAATGADVALAQSELEETVRAVCRVLLDPDRFALALQSPE